MAEQKRFIRYDGKLYPAATKPTFDESAAIEAESGVPLSKMQDAHMIRADIILALRRGGLVITWAALGAMSPEDFQVVDEEGRPVTGDEPDPTQAAPGPRVPQDRKVRATGAAARKRTPPSGR